MHKRIVACSFLAALCLAVGAQAAHGQTLVYMATYVNTPASFRAQYPNGIFGTKLEQRVAMTRQTRKNEIWGVSLKDGKRTLLFSDAGMNFELIQVVNRGSPVNERRNVVYVRGVERDWQGPPKRATPGVYETPVGIYEVSLDGTNHFRRLFDATQNMSVAMVNAAGTRAAFWGWEDKGGYFLYVYELPSAKLLTRANITKILQTHCGNCLPETSGWLADGKTLYFTLQEGDEDGPPDDASADVPGTYLVSSEGAGLGNLPLNAGEINLPDYKRLISLAPYLIEETTDGRYIFRDCAEKKGSQPKPPAVLDGFLVFTGRDFKPQKQIPLEKQAGSAFEVSPDGTFLAFVKDRQLPNYKRERHIWALNLQTGEKKELFVVPPPNPPTSPTPNESATIMGWLEQ